MQIRDSAVGDVDMGFSLGFESIGLACGWREFIVVLNSSAARKMVWNWNSSGLMVEMLCDIGRTAAKFCLFGGFSREISLELAGPSRFIWMHLDRSGADWI